MAAALGAEKAIDLVKAVADVTLSNAGDRDSIQTSSYRRSWVLEMWEECNATHEF